jgi:hypothetical protein
MTDKESDSPPNTPCYRSWPERQAAQRAAQEAEHQALSQRIQASRENRGVDEREHAQRRHLADIEAFRALMVMALEPPSPVDETSILRGPTSSFKMICALIAQRAHELPSLLEPKYLKSLGFHYRMIETPAVWIATADRLAEHAKGGITREITAFGPFAGLRVSTRVILLTSGINTASQLRAAIQDGTVALDHDISSDGFTRRRWTELRDWLARQPPLPE